MTEVAQHGPNYGPNVGRWAFIESMENVAFAFKTELIRDIDGWLRFLEALDRTQDALAATAKNPLRESERDSRACRQNWLWPSQAGCQCQWA